MPNEPGTSLYIRPFVIATDASLGVHASHSYLFCIITGPVGAYYAEGINPVKIYAENDDVRAVKGGTAILSAAVTTLPPSAPVSGRRSRATPRSSGWTASTGSILKKWAL